MNKKRKRRNFLPTLFFALLFWIGWSWLVYTFPPNSDWLLALFFLLLFLAVFLTGALIFANSRRGFLLATAIIVFLILRYHQLANFLNLSLFLGILLCLEIYYVKHG
jgi:hypothetical protein